MLILNFPPPNRITMKMTTSMMGRQFRFQAGFQALRPFIQNISAIAKPP